MLIPVLSKVKWSTPKNCTFQMYRVSIELKKASGSLGEREMLWEHEPQASVSTAFSNSPKLSRVCLNSTKTRRTCFLFLFRNSATEKRKQLYFDHQNVNYLCSRHHYVNSSFCVSIDRNTILNQSARVVDFFGLFYHAN